MLAERLLPRFCGVLCLAVLLLSSPQGWPEEPAGSFDWLRNHFSYEERLTYRFQSLEGDEDSDFYDARTIRARGLLDGWLDAYFSGRFHKDLDGNANSLAADPFVSLEDREEHWESQVYQLYGDLHHPGGDFGLRLGRQYIEQADWLHIDGGQLRLFEKGRLRAQGFFGRPVSYYSGTSGDWAGGFSLEGRLDRAHRLRLAYSRYEDDSLDQKDDQYSLDAWQRWSDSIRTHSRLSFLDDRFQTAALDFIYVDLDGTLDAVLGVRHWGGFEGESREYSPLYSVLGELEPYTYLSGRCTVALNSWLSVSPGVAERLVQGSHRDGRNRQYGNYDLTFVVEPNPQWTLSMSGQYWDVSGGDQFWGLTGEVEYRPSKILRVSMGTAYLDYEYHRDSDYGYSFENGGIRGRFDGVTNYVTTVSPDAYTVYARAKVKLTEWLALRVQGEIEDDSEEEDLFYGLRTSVALRF